MKQASLKLKSYAGSVNIVNNDNLERRILHIMLVSLGALALLYALVLGNTVWNIVERRTLETDARTLTNEVGDLELSYLSMSNKIDASLGYSMGFREKDAKFAVRKPLGLVDTTSESLGNVKSVKNEI
ncbi:hypothetical protein A2911_01110 [Candidatus Nomurabacteria bacterium RIFCSPLOWO2_01_FULL_40_15]|uniref:Cell division protein FtsL n=1 Tax=Candidatus Nomurabacteria bacterium RIFCSPLOWO2_01_FULL_40_15 TaxID=1801772 RepID=A0A1F6X5A4_9BACT|nr:MAG: hypothetical protein A2911_01110 [Candidatus Nomurabacteria bacterium RIFCSPLOWO2_01_FULL_40_15]